MKEKIKEAIKAIEKGMSIRQAAELYGISKSTLSYYVQKQKQQPQQQSEPQPTEPETETAADVPVSHETFESSNFENEIEQYQNIINELQNELALKTTEIKTLQAEIGALKQRIQNLQKQGGCEMKSFIEEMGYKCSDIIRFWRVFTYAFWRYYQVARRARRKTKYFIWAGVQLLEILKKHGEDTKKILNDLKYSEQFEKFWLWCSEVDAMFRRDKKAMEILNHFVLSKATSKDIQKQKAKTAKAANSR